MKAFFLNNNINQFKYQETKIYLSEKRLPLHDIINGVVSLGCIVSRKELNLKRSCAFVHRSKINSTVLFD